MRSTDEIAANAELIWQQIQRVAQNALGADALPRFAVRNNAEWLGQQGLIEFLRDTGKHFTVNWMMQKDSVKTRMETGISFTEFSYMLLQAYDFARLFAKDGVTLQLGGSDQWGNITAGTELIRRTQRGEAHGLTFPLLTDAQGKKFGKTEAGAVYLDAKLTSVYKFYQFWINAEDADVGRLLRTFTLLGAEEIAGIEATHAAAPHERGAQKRLARDVTAMIHAPRLPTSPRRSRARCSTRRPTRMRLATMCSPCWRRRCRRCPFRPRPRAWTSSRCWPRPSGSRRRRRGSWCSRGP